MMTRILTFALTLTILIGCSDPVSVLETESPATPSASSGDRIKDDSKRTSKTIAEIVLDVNAESGEFSVLLAALTRVDLVAPFLEKTPKTVFAPTDAAFLALLDELGLQSLDDIDDATLTTVLLYHVTGGRWFSNRVLHAESIPTLQGGSLQVDAENAALIDANGRSAQILVGAGLFDITAKNGVIHVIDRVVLP
ncbi:MAG: fasciclin domain-containing protein [Rhodothermales bacterium]